MRDVVLKACPYAVFGLFYFVFLLFELVRGGDTLTRALAVNPWLAYDAFYPFAKVLHRGIVYSPWIIFLGLVWWDWKRKEWFRAIAFLGGTAVAYFGTVVYIAGQLSNMD